MQFSRILLSFAVSITLGQSLWANAINGGTATQCVQGTLSSYIDGVNSGCALGVLVSTSWGLDPSGIGGSTGGATFLNASQIEITPLESQNGLGGSFTFNAEPDFSFGVGAGQTATYFIEYSYFIDPGPVMDDGGLSLDPPVGDVSVTQFFCNDLNLFSPGSSPVCAALPPSPGSPAGTPPQTLHVTVPMPNDFKVFSPPAFIFGSIETEIALGGPDGISNFDHIVSTLDVVESPEPASVLLSVLGLVAVGARRIFASRF